MAVEDAEEGLAVYSCERNDDRVRVLHLISRALRGGDGTCEREVRGRLCFHNRSRYYFSYPGGAVSMGVHTLSWVESLSMPKPCVRAVLGSVDPRRIQAHLHRRWVPFELA